MVSLSATAVKERCAEAAEAEPRLKDCAGMQRYEKPAFIIAGAPKCGTTSLDGMLRVHPDVRMKEHETHFWTKHPTGSMHKYTALLWSEKQHTLVQAPESARHDGSLVGEDSPTYLWMWTPRKSPEETIKLACSLPVPLQVRCCLPDVKFFASIRNPVTRLISNFIHFQQGGKGPHFSADGLHRFVEWNIGMHRSCCPNGLPQRKEDVFADGWLECAACFERRTIGTGFARVWIGVYVYHFAMWARYYPRNAFYITTLEKIATMSQDPEQLRQMLDHAGLARSRGEIDHMAREARKVRNRRKWNWATHKKTLDMLMEYYKPFNEALAEWLGEDYPLEWNRVESVPLHYRLDSNNASYPSRVYNKPGNRAAAVAAAAQLQGIGGLHAGRQGKHGGHRSHDDEAKHAQPAH